MTPSDLKAKKVLTLLIAGTLLTLLMVGCSSQFGSNEAVEGTGAGERDEEESGTMLSPNATLDQNRAGARLLLDYDASANTFVGTVANTTDQMLKRVRVEVHLNTGTELGPTTPVDVAAGNTVPVALPGTGESFTGWTAHAEVGGSGEEDGSEHGPGGEAGGEHNGSERGSGGEHSGGG